MNRIEEKNRFGVHFVLNPSSLDFATYANDPAGPILISIEEDDNLLLDLHLRYARRALQVFTGRNRNTFVLNETIVVKLPRNAQGCIDNDWEGSVSNTTESFNDPFWTQYPRTRLAVFKEIPVVFMEKIQPLTSSQIIELFGHEPDWVAGVDCGQVGINRFGRLVAYDYGVC